MKTWSVALVLTCAACSSKSDNLPVGGGGGGTGGGGGGVDAPKTVDAAIDAVPSAIDAALVNGRVCLLLDPRHLGLDPATDCDSTNAGGLTVRIGSKTATTAVDGRFTIDGTDAKAGAIWGVTGTNIVSSYEVFSDYQIPAMTTTMFNNLKTTNGVIILPGQGSIFAQLVRNGAGQAATTAISTPSSEYEAFYDNNASATTWTQGSGGTGTGGVVWLPGINVGTATVTAPPPPAQGITTPALPVADGAITFVTITFP